MSSTNWWFHQCQQCFGYQKSVEVKLYDVNEKVTFLLCHQEWHQPVLLRHFRNKWIRSWRKTTQMFHLLLIPVEYYCNACWPEFNNWSSLDWTSLMYSTCIDRHYLMDHCGLKISGCALLPEPSSCMAKTSSLQASMMNRQGGVRSLADIDNNGSLTVDEFCVALHLVEMTKLGQTLPSVLPLDLVPPAYRSHSPAAATLNTSRTLTPYVNSAG